MVLLTVSGVILLAIISLVIFALLWASYKVVIRPLYRMCYCKNQGIETYYAPLIGRYQQFEKATKLHGDDQYFSKVGARNKVSRALCSNLGSAATIVLRDPVLIKDFYLNNDNYVKDPLYLESMSVILGHVVLTPEGNLWMTLKRFCLNLWPED